MSPAGNSSGPGLKAGKLPPAILKRLLGALPRRDRRVLVGPGVGEDSAAVAFGAVNLIAKSDPVTFATDLIGWYAVHVNANDVAATGGTPRWFLPTVLIPEGEPVETAERIFQQIAEAANSIGVELIGGHTEITVGLPRPIVCGTMLGEARPSKTLPTSGAMPGNAVLLTGGIAIEGASLIARERKDELSASGVPEDLIARAANFLFEPGISVLKDAQTAMAAGIVTAMHDPTEGGLATALAELAEASGTGLQIEERSVPVLPEAARIAAAVGVDVWGLIASGALLITCPESDVDSILARLTAEGRLAARIGTVVPRVEGLNLIDGEGNMRPMPRFDRDEIARLFER